MTQPASVADYRELARRRLPAILFQYMDGGSYAEVTLRRNVEDMEALALRQRVLVDVSKLNMAVELFGQQLSMPLMLGPVGMSGMYSRRGECSAARAAHKAGLVHALSTLSICGIEEVSRAAPIWYQLYMVKDRGYMRALLQRAKDAKVGCLLFTVDLPVPGTRYRDYRTGLTGTLSTLDHIKRAWDGITHPDWFWDVYLQGRPHDFGNLQAAIAEAEAGADYWAWIRNNFDPSLTWNDFAWIREHWDGPIVIKGVLDPEDAKECVRVGAEGIVVSNHGGRQLDGALSSIAALPAIADAVGDDLTVLMDGGVRNGLDILKAMALGAKGVLIGRAWAYALAAHGEAGVSHILATLRAELAAAMALTGCTDVTKADRTLLANL